MSFQVDGKPMAIGCTFRWKIQNISVCWLRRGKGIESPAFIADSLEKTKWSLQFYPQGETIYNRVGFYLHREKDSKGPDAITVNYQLAILSKKDSFLTERTVLEYEFEKDKRDGFEDYTERDRIFDYSNETYLPNDTLTLQCMIWYKAGTPILQQHFFARTIYKENTRSFIWKLENFSSLKVSPTKRFKHDLIEFDVFLSEDDSGVHKLLMLSINLLNERLKYFSFKASIVDNEGKKETYRPIEYFPDNLKRGIIPMVMFNNTTMENKSLYFPNDVLTLDCEYNIPTETALLIFSGSDRIGGELNKVVESRNENYMVEKTLLKDLKFMFNDAICSDIEIRTSCRSFPAHKAILSARSPVFRSMFSHDMKEKNSGHIDIVDFNEDAIYRMLLFLYTGSLEDLHFESASALYRIADKYDIPSLKRECSSFLQENLWITNVFDILVLADLHNDKHLKKDAQDYLLAQRNEIFGSLEWKYFMDKHLKLAAEIPCLSVQFASDFTIFFAATL